MAGVPHWLGGRNQQNFDILLSPLRRDGSDQAATLRGSPRAKQENKTSSQSIDGRQEIPIVHGVRLESPHTRIKFRSSSMEQFKGGFRTEVNTGGRSNVGFFDVMLTKLSLMICNSLFYMNLITKKYF
ncbi:hypothetical protein [Pseudomonas sp. dw_358]|uniref:hypothetical protein n=1 Tax=Pseudomonas sp. dw_358 TaxID=2720083 RepID=UPI001BD581C0|nr:hypothetical protein [Pseudomonas sp. dw_358]